ncbi:MAG TPA: hypothetical protein VEC11_00970 [Allosphingosinicella sp.]|nr:hypothetical protein [Allosphingosinicella sp.]
MNASFSFQVDPSRDLVRIQMAGLFTPADIHAFLEARRRAHAELRCAPNRHLTLNDLRGMKIQSQEGVAAFRDMLADPAFRSRRLAFVAAPTLARSQLVRALDGRDARCFDEPGEAEAWLLDEEIEQPVLRYATR